MSVFLIVLFWLNSFMIFWAMIGYPVFIKVYSRKVKKQDFLVENDYEPTVTIMIVAHNEEKVILEKLKNVCNLIYNANKIEILVSSDNSNDSTNDIVRQFIANNSNHKVRLFEVKERKGKTNAQNEAAKTILSDIIIMTDANAMLDQFAVFELVKCFSDEHIGYVTGKLIYINNHESWTSKSESAYWDWDLKMREVESGLHSVTAGNGALYACRTSEYFNFDPIMCHDSAMPPHVVLQGKRAVYNSNAIAYEKAGTHVEDEFSRKVRMSRRRLNSLIPDFRLLNVFKYQWFSFCYFGHRVCRNNLWFQHGIVLLTSALLMANSVFFLMAFVGQVLFYAIATFKHFNNQIDHKIINMIYYYSMTIFAQGTGAFRQLTGKSKPFWEKAESTR